MDFDPASVAGLAERLGIIGLLVIAVLGYHRRWVVPKAAQDEAVDGSTAHLAEVRTQRDEWRSTANEALDRVEALADALGTSADRLREAHARIADLEQMVVDRNRGR